MTTVTAQRQRAAGELSEFRRRLLGAMAASIGENGYRDTTVAEVVRRARTSRRTFYEHFAGKEDCFVELLTDTNTLMVQTVYAAVDQDAPWQAQVRQAVEAWITCAESEPAIMLSWIRDVPSLGEAARRLQRDTMEAFVTMIQALCDTDQLRAAGIGPVPRPVVVMLLGGLRELTATTVEDGGRVSDLTEVAVRAATSLLTPIPL